MITTEQATRSDEIRCYFENIGHSLPIGPQINICCPIHDEESPSFSMNIVTGGWTCHAECGHGYFPELRARIDAKRSRAGDADELPEGMQEEIDAENRAKRRSETVYPYHDEASRELYRLIRYDLANGSKTFISEKTGENGNYIKDIKGVRRVPYRLPEMLQADLVIIVEGEKCADAVNALDLSRIKGCKVAATATTGEQTNGKKTIIPTSQENELSCCRTMTNVGATT